MATISLDKQITQYLPQLDSEEKKSLLGVIKSFLKLKDVQQPQRLTIEQYNKELEEAEKRYDAGFFTSHEDVLKEAGSW
jgi:hypothetical protein